MEHRNTHTNSPFLGNSDHYSENTENNEDHIVEGEIYSGASEISKSSVKYSGDVNSEISITTSILDVEDQDIKVLEKQLDDLEYKIKYLENENKKINDDLLNEKKKTSKLEKKLQFVKDNQEVFMRLKEVYINMKYNEAAGRKMIEIRERGVQTWAGMVCSSCIESEEFRRQVDIMMQKYKELFVVSPGEMEHLLNTVKYLKDLILRREESWAFNMEREHKLQTYISILESENAKFRANRQNNEDIPNNGLDHVKTDDWLGEDNKTEGMQKVIAGLTKELEKLKKIIIKYERKFRELKEQHPSKYMSPLNEKEIKMVQHIIVKYDTRIQKRNTANRSRTSSVDSERTQLYHRSSTSRDVPCRRLKSPERPKSARHYNKRTDSAVMMLDCLFE